MDRPFFFFFFLAFSLFCFPALSSASGPVFYESFDETWEGRWIPSTKEEYSGIWKHAKSEGHEDFGLLVSEKARKYGVAVELPAGGFEVFDKPVVLQYDVRLQNGLECGGAYLKFLSLTEATDKLDNESPYTIMFGPDKCGSTNKVHFIFRHKNPKTEQYIEHHLKYPPTPVNDKLSHVYTAIIYPNNTLFILIDGEVKKTADLLSSNDFEPPLILAKLIPDPDDKKPEDWDEQEKIPDPDAKKPDDWDEDAPMEIEDLESEKPQNWLDDEPEEIDDPDAVKPEDWDDEEDGEWEAPKVSNPKCSDAPGCGKWERPKKMNPAYKGKWYPPMIENPHYQGIWKPREIANPDYFELDKPNLEAIGAIGIEIWTMQDGILFDNILVARDDAVALEYREKTWKVKYEAEKAAQPEPESPETKLSGLQGQVFEFLRYVAGLSVLSGQKEKLNAWIAKGEEKPTLTIGLLAVFSAVVLLLLYRLLFGMKKAAPTAEEVAVERAKKEDISTPDDVNAEASKESMEENVEEVVEGEEEGSTLRKRQNQQE